ncbi:MarC family protein [Thiolapillus sp.]|uniref:MarC family protein n=2 Tax=Thiolapillus sp. TaxID=2017437 RepID=UPI0025F80E5B
MLELAQLFLHDVIALVTILNPIAAASIMVSLINPTDLPYVKKTARAASITVFVASVVTLVGGGFIFHVFGINVLSIKVIGGVVLIMLAMNMINGRVASTRHSSAENQEAQEKEDISVIPLAIPILFGPGVIATLVVLNNRSVDLLEKGILYGAVLVSTIAVFFTLRYAVTINRFLGETGTRILTRLMGLVVGAIAAQFLVEGVKGLWLAAA